MTTTPVASPVEAPTSPAAPTAAPTTPGVTTGPAHALRRARWPLVVVGLVALAVLLTYLASGKGNDEPLDPDGTGPDGARALARVIDGHGVPVQLVRSDAELSRASAADPAATVVVSQTYRLLTTDIDALRQLAPGAGPLVLVQPDQGQLDALAAGVRLVDSGFRTTVAPGCAVPAAVAAGRADAGGGLYELPARGTGCYRVDGHPSYVVLPGPRPTIVIGQSSLLTNERLAKEGNAALAIRTLGGTDRLIWFVPAGQGGASPQQASLRSLLPRWVDWVVLQLFAVVVVCMLWRARRLGRLVPEPLPVVVRAVETTEGRARMYRRSRAQARAAATLRAAELARLRRRAGLPRGAGPAEIAAVLAGRIGIPPAHLQAVLAGPPPTDDAGLVGLAQLLDEIDREVRRP